MGYQMRQEKFRKKFNDRYDGIYELVSEYSGTRGKILMRCVHCGNIREKKAEKAMYYNILWCEYCQPPKQSTDAKLFRERFDLKYEGVFELVTDYLGTKSDITIRCCECGAEYTVLADNLINLRIKKVCTSKICKPTTGRYKRHPKVEARMRAQGKIK